MSDNTIMRKEDYFAVLDKVKSHIIDAQKAVMNTANVERNIMYWRIGKTIVEHSVWGNKFVDTLSKDLRMEYPESKGYSARNLNYMKQFATLVPSEEFLQQGAAKINWRSIVFLINQTKDTDEFLRYANQCIEQGWSRVSSKTYVSLSPWRIHETMTLLWDKIRQD